MNPIENPQVAVQAQPTVVQDRPGVGVSDQEELQSGSAASKWGPTLLVISIVGIVFLGEHYNWKLPSFGRMTGLRNDDPDDWCKEHNVAESRCVECNPSLLPKGRDYGWCIEHGVHNCTLDHPDVAELKEPASPDVVARMMSNAAAALNSTSRKINNSRCTLYQSRIQFDSAEAIVQAGIEVDLVESGSVLDSIAGNGEIVYDQTRTASLSCQQLGTLVLIGKSVGDRVARGEVVAVVDVRAVGEAKSSLLRAIAELKLQQLTVDRLTLAKDSIAMSKTLDARASLSKATADVLSAEQSLRNLGIAIEADKLLGLDERSAMESIRLAGIPESLYPQLDTKLTSTNLLPVVSPIDATVTERHASLGEIINASQELIRVADTSKMWMQLNIPLESVDRINVGQKVQFIADGAKEPVTGQLDWISTSANHDTRMVQARATLSNTDGRLRNNTFGTGSIALREASDVVIVPTNATHWEGCCQIVFVRDKHFFDSKESPKVFHVRSIRLGAVQGDRVEVVAGLLPGEVIVTRGSDVLRAQLLKNGLGAGCCVGE